MGREKGYKTRQKEAILEFFKGADRHVTVNEVANYLRESGNPVGVTTVYRYIDTLLSSGLVQKYMLEGENSAVYEYIGSDCCRNHFHLKCELCGKLIHMECDQMRVLYDHVQMDHDFQVSSSKTVFWGKCGSCRGNEIIPCLNK